MSITARQFIISFVVLFLALWGISSLRSHTISNRVESKALEQLEVNTIVNRGRIGQYLQKLTSRAEDFSSDGFIRDAASSILQEDGQNTVEELNDHLRRNKKSLDKYIIGINVLDLNGTVVSSTDSLELGKDFSGNRFFTKTIENEYGVGAVYEGEEVTSFGTTDPVIIAAAPLTNKETQQTIGIIINYISFTEFSELILSVENNIQTTNTNLSNYKTYVVGSDESFILTKNGISPVQSANVELPGNWDGCTTQRAFSGRNQASQSREMLVAVSCTPSGLAVVTEVPLSFVVGGIFLDNSIYLLGLLGIAILGAVYFSFIVWFSFTRHINTLAIAAEQVRNNNFKVQLPDKTSALIASLVNSFGEMIERLKYSYVSLQGKIEEKTAELKETIADIENKNIELEQTQSAMMNILEDVEQEKEKSEQLGRDLRKFKLAVENTSEHIVITDPEARILYANPAVETITGYSPNEIIGKKPQDLWGGEMGNTFYKEMWAMISRKKTPYETEIRNVRKDGMGYIANVYVSPILDDDNDIQFFVAVERDITKAKEVDKMKTEFLSLASHQLRTPLSSMKWYVELLREESELSDEQQEYVANIHHSNERMIELVNALLNVSRIESGRIIIDPQPTHVNALWEEVLADVEDIRKDKNHTIHKYFGEYLPAISIDQNLIRQVMQNLLTNSIKYTPENGEIGIATWIENGYIVNEIKDNGIGIPENEQPAIFTKFHRAVNVKKSSAEGNGLGLYLVKAIIDSSGGKITFESKENEGTTFRFYLPLSGSEAKEGEVTIT